MAEQKVLLKLLLSVKTGPPSQDFISYGEFLTFKSPLIQTSTLLFCY